MSKPPFTMPMALSECGAFLDSLTDERRTDLANAYVPPPEVLDQIKSVVIEMTVNGAVDYEVGRALWMIGANFDTATLAERMVLIDNAASYAQFRAFQDLLAGQWD